MKNSNLAIRKLIRKSDGKTVSNSCAIANTFFSRFKGLMGKESLPQGEALLIESCNSIHTFFMKFPIDVAYLSGSGNEFKVIMIRRDMTPWRVDFPVFGAKAVLEMASGAMLDLSEGEILCLS